MTRHIGHLALIAIMLGVSVGAAGAEQCLYLAAGGKITVYRIDEASGKLSPHQEIELPGAGPLGVSPDKRHLYAVAALPKPGKRRGQPAIATYSLGTDGRLEHVHTAEANLRAGYLMTDATGRFLAGSHYGPGKATIWRLADGVYRGELVQELPFEKCAHSSIFSPDNRWLLVPATGPNKVFIDRFDAQSGKAVPNDPPFAEGPPDADAARCPRHLIFHPTRPFAYTSNERELPGVGAWKWDTDRGTLTRLQNIVTLPDGFTGRIATADLHLTPDARFLYVSNRDVTDRKARTGRDSIVGFSVDAATGRLALIGRFPCEHVPRSFVLDETGRFLYVAGQSDDRLGLYGINPTTGHLTKLTQYETGPRPIWVHCMSPPGGN